MTRAKLAVRYALVTAATLLVAGLTWWAVQVHAELSEKAVYAALQGVEIDSRDHQLKTPAIIQNAGDAGEVLGLSTGDPKFPYTWISLSELGSKGEVLEVSPTDKIVNSCLMVVKSLHGHNVNPAVRQSLVGRCSQP